MPGQSPFQERDRDELLALLAAKPDAAAKAAGREMTSLRRLRAMTRQEQDAYLERVAERACRGYEAGSELLAEAYGNADWVEEEDCPVESLEC